MGDIAEPRFLLARSNAVTEYALAALVVAVATVIRYWLGIRFDVSPPYLLYYPAVMFVAQRDLRSGILAVLLSVVAADYFFIAPSGSLVIARVADIVALCVFVVTALALCILVQKRQESERELAVARRSELLVAALTGMGEGLLTATTGGVITYMNDACARLLGIGAASAIGRLVPEVVQLVEPDSGLPIRDVFGRLLRAEPLSDRDRYAVLCGREGQRTAVDVVAFAPRDAGEADPGVLIAFRDFSEHARVKESLWEVNARFEMAANAARLGVWERNLVTNTVYWDAQMYRLYGRTLTEGLQPYSLWAGCLHPEDRRATEQAVADAVQGGARLDVEFRIVRPDGEIRHLHSSATIVRDGLGRPLRIVGVSFDVTERWLATEQFRLAVEASPTGMVMADPDGTIVLVNGQAEAAFGYTRAELLGRKVQMLLPDGGQGRDAGRELFGRRKDGVEFSVEIGVNPIVTTHGRYILTSITDISERKRYLASLHAANAALEEQVAQRTAQLRERETLLQEVHHRVKNNLQVISSLISMQIRSLKDSAGQPQLEECRTRIQTMALIHERLYQAKDYSRVAFDEYLKGLAANLLAALAPPTSDLTLQLDLEEVWLPVDLAIPCGLILNELITNSVKHAFPAGTRGVISISMRNMAGDRVAICVRDNGPGIPTAQGSAEPRSLGLRLIALLMEQLHAEHEISATAGTAVSFSFNTRSA